MSKVSVMLSGIVFSELVSKLDNYWYLFIFILNMILVFFNVLYDIIKKFKSKSDDKLNISNYIPYQEYYNKFGEDLKSYYEKHKV